MLVRVLWKKRRKMEKTGTNSLKTGEEIFELLQFLQIFKTDTIRNIFFYCSFGCIALYLNLTF